MSRTVALARSNGNGSDDALSTLFLNGCSVISALSGFA
jgi:hypothetical protein